MKLRKHHAWVDGKYVNVYKVEDLRERLKGRIEKAVKASEQSLTIDRELMKERTVECVFNSGRANSFRELLAELEKGERE